MFIQTLTTIKRARARADRRRLGAARVVTAMQGGEALQKHFTRQGPVFLLTNGKSVSADVAVVVIRCRQRGIVSLHAANVAVRRTVNRFSTSTRRF